MESTGGSSGNARGCQPRLDDISVVIPTVGRPILQKCLRSIASGDELPRAIIVVDQSSNTEIGKWLQDLDVHGVETKHISSSQTGRAAGVNRGIENVDTEFCAITDDDCLVASDWLRNMRVHLTATPSEVITGRVEAGGDELVAIVVTSMTPATFNRPRLKFDSLCGGNMGVALAVMNRVGLLDEDPVVRCSEDGEWAYRALRAGVSIKYAPNVVVYHYGWRNLQERQDQYRVYAISHGGFYGKYLRKRDWFIALRVIVHFLRESRRFLRGILTRNHEEIRMSRAYLRWLGPGIWAGIKSKNNQVAPKAMNDK